MAVARSYEKYELQGEPFEENGRMYVNVLAPKGTKKVRWYTDSERAAQDRKAGVEVKKNALMDFNARHAFGFGDLGFITLYKTTSERLLEDFVESHIESFRYNLTFQHYTPSRIPVPELPAGIEAIRLNWEQVQDYETRMRPHEEIAKLVRDLISPSGDAFSSVYQGEPGAWLEKDVVVRDNIARTSYYGEKHTHYLVDTEGNTYVWETGTKNLEVGVATRLKMKVKEYREINGEKCTVVWYCKEI
mgnify:CR=1 FL=1